MFDMMPYAWNRSQNLLDSFADFEKNFFGEMSRSVSGFNTDIRDNGSEYVLEAELPGFNKEDIQVRSTMGCCTSPQSTKRSRRRRTRNPDSISVGNAGMVPSSGASPSMVWTRTRLRVSIRMAC